MLNKVDKVESYSKKLNEKFDIKNDVLSNKELKKIIKKLDSISPSNLKQIYKDEDIKICHKFISESVELDIDIDTINIKSMKLNYSKFSEYKTKIVSEIEDTISEMYKNKEKLKNTKDKELRYYYLENIEKTDNYINELSKQLDNDLTIITKVDSIDVVRNKLGLIKNVIVNKTYTLNIGEVLNEKLFCGKYKVLEVIDGNFVVNTLKGSATPKVEYYAHTDIDSVYGLEGNWGLVDKDGNFIIEPIYIYPFLKCGDNLQVMLPETIKDGVITTLKHGLIDTRGNIIIPIKYLYMEVMDNSGTYFRVADPDSYKSGVLDNKNNVVIPFKYDYISAIPDLELCSQTEYCSTYPDFIYQVKVCKKDLYGIYDLKLKKEIIKPKYKEIRIIGYNRFLVGEDYESCNTLINEKGKKIKA